MDRQRKRHECAGPPARALARPSTRPRALPDSAASTAAAMNNNTQNLTSPADAAEALPKNTKITIGACVGSAVVFLLLLAAAMPLVKRWHQRCLPAGATANNAANNAANFDANNQTINVGSAFAEYHWVPTAAR
ncbi:hypothetical protein UCDDS831_g02824 [Diplodia seriata]|uniref:Uncharacterized protein n=1 Tax=Diplodia seriata TaxID=420778 RepID=A0A0G2GJV9_9PEZI|nr:hypothetical protein UCDDS831_g02824 [Diplodia seriata]